MRTCGEWDAAGKKTEVNILEPKLGNVKMVLPGVGERLLVVQRERFVYDITFIEIVPTIHSTTT